MKIPLILGTSLFFLTACSGSKADPQGTFFTSISELCGQAYHGRLVSSDEADATLRDEPMLMHVRDCSDTEIRIPFMVGDDRSRVWVITKGDDSLTLKHVHRHEDGTTDVLSNYGGTTADTGTPTRQNFPADDFSKDLFTREGIPQSTENVWSLEIIEGEKFAYELSRPGRFFRAEFELLGPAPTPPAPWGEAE